MRTLIIEDELPQAAALEKLLFQHWPEAEIHLAETKDKAAKALENQSFDLVLADILLGSDSVFDVFGDSLKSGFRLIMISAHNDFASQAFAAHACSYILKPWKEDQVVSAVYAALASGGQWRREDQIASLAQAMQEQTLRRIFLPTQEGFDILEINRIVAVEAGRSYCTFHLVGGERRVVSRSLAWAEHLLLSLGFYRTHRSWLVNPRHIQAFIRQEGPSLRMAGGLLVAVAERSKDAVLRWLQNLGIGGS
jgi:two-component system LytT family response regulator